MGTKKSVYKYFRQIHFKSKTVKRDKEEHYIITKVNSPGKYDIHRYICESTQIYEADIDRLGERYRKSHNNIRRFQYLTFNHRYNDQTDD